MRLKQSSGEPQDDASRGVPLTGRAFWLLGAKSLAFAFSFALPLLLVRWLSQSDFGAYKQVFLVVGTAMMVLPLGFGMSAFYFLPREPERRGQIVLNILLVNTIVGVAVCAALAVHPMLLSAVLNNTELLPYAALIGVVVLFWTVSSFLETVAIAHQETTVATLFIIGAQVSKTILLVAAVAIFGSVGALIWAAVIQGALQTLVLLFYLNSRFRGFWRDFSWAMLKTQLAYALPLGAVGVLYSLQNDIHNYFVANRFGAAAFAVYAIGCFQLPIIAILNDSVGSVMIPRVSYLQKHDQKREIILLTARAMRKLAAVYFPLYIFLIVMSREFILALFTERYLESLPVFLINATLIPFNILVTDPSLRAYAEQRYFLLRLKVTVFVCLFAVFWFGTSRLGLIGAIATVVGANIFERLVMAFRIARVLNISWRDLPLFKDVGKLAAAATASGVVAAVVYGFAHSVRPVLLLLLVGVVFGAVYLSALLLMGILTDDERRFFRRHALRLFRTSWRRAEEVS